MKISNSITYVAAVSAAVALLAGCTGNGGPVTPAGSSMAPSARHALGTNHTVNPELTLIVPRSVKPDLSKKIRSERVMKPNCCALQKTLFLTDAFGGSSFTGAVYAFDYVTGAFLGQVAAPPEGFLEVQGACSDNNGNVYFANTDSSTIDEYTHSGAFVTALSDPGEFPVGCSYDRSSGVLAVSNIIDTSGGPGSISIFSGGMLQGTFSPPNMSRVYSIGFQGKTSVLWVSGDDSSGIFQYDSCNNGKCVAVGIHGVDIGFPGAVQWSAQTKTMVVGDQDTFSAPAFYWVNDSGNVVGQTVLQCDQQSDFCDIAQAAIKGSGIVGSDAIALTAARYAFSAGGPPILFYRAPFAQPIGAAVSPDKSGSE